MQSVLLIGAMLIACAALPASGQGGQVTKVFIFAGQSNMDGRGKKSELTGELAAWARPQADVRIAYSNSTIRGPYATDGFLPLEPGFSVPPGTREKHGKDYKLPAAMFGPEVSFGRTVADALPAEKIVIIKFSEGGTTLRKDWDPDRSDGLYAQFVPFVRKSLQALSDAGEKYEIAGIVWHQGESDASLAAGEYQKLLTAFIARVRSDLAAPGATFVIGEVFDNGKRDKVRAGELATAETVPGACFASAKDLSTSDNGTHFDTASQIKLGQRMAAAWLEALKRSAPAAATQP